MEFSRRPVRQGAISHLSPRVLPITLNFAITFTPTTSLDRRGPTRASATTSCWLAPAAAVVVWRRASGRPARCDPPPTVTVATANSPSEECVRSACARRAREHPVARRPSPSLKVLVGAEKRGELSNRTFTTEKGKKATTRRSASRFKITSSTKEPVSRNEEWSRFALGP